MTQEARRTICGGVCAAILLSMAIAAVPSAKAAPQDVNAAATRSAIRGFNTRQLADWVDDQQADFDKAIQEIDESGAGIHRLSVYWADVQPDPNSGMDWHKYDPIVMQLRNRGLKIILTPIGSPNWARIEKRRNGNPLAHPSVGFFDDWNTFVGAMAHRYRADAYEIWNEENSTAFWDPTPTQQKPNPKQWTQLFCGAAKAIRDVLDDPNATVGVGGLAPHSSTSKDGRKQQAREFLLDAYDAGLKACKPSFVGFHPYVINAFCNNATHEFPDLGTMKELQKVHNAAKAHGMPSIWNTEWGFPSQSFSLGNGKGVCGYTPARQAKLIRDEYNYLTTLPWVKYSIYFNIRDDTTANPCRIDKTTLPPAFASTGMDNCRWTRKRSFGVWQSLP